MKDLIKDLREGTNKRPYSFQEICPSLLLHIRLVLRCPNFKNTKAKVILDIMSGSSISYAKRFPIVIYILGDFSQKVLQKMPSLGSPLCHKALSHHSLTWLENLWIITPIILRMMLP